MDIPFEGSVSQSEYVAAAKLAASPKFGPAKGKFSPAFWWLGFGIDYLILCLACLIAYRIRNDFSDAALAAIALIPGLILTRQGVRWLNYARDKWIQSPILRKPRHGMISDGGVEILTDGEQSRTEWPAITGYGDYRNVVILMHRTGYFSIYPKSLFASEADWHAFRSLLNRKLELAYAVPPDDSWRTAKGILPVVLFHLFFTAVLIGWALWEF